MFLIRLVQVFSVFALTYGLLTNQIIPVVAGIGFGVQALIEFRFCDIEERCNKSNGADNDDESVGNPPRKPNNRVSSCNIDSRNRKASADGCPARMS